MEVSREVADIITQATREFTRHLLCECDPTTCEIEHDARWWERRVEKERETARYEALRAEWRAQAEQ